MNIHIDYAKIINETISLVAKIIIIFFLLYGLCNIFGFNIKSIDFNGIKIELKDMITESTVEDIASGRTIIPSEKTVIINDIYSSLSKTNSHGEGYIFIGDFDKNTWNKKMFSENFSSPLEISIGDSISLTSNMYIRSKMPQNDIDYFKNIKAIGILQKGRIVTIASKPEGIKRNHATQWWVKVEF